jgi:hypothetical protein
VEKGKFTPQQLIYDIVDDVESIREERSKFGMLVVAGMNRGEAFKLRRKLLKLNLATL